jgi:acetyltransferase-like isoleucine patch superfamily enzyme
MSKIFRLVVRVLFYITNAFRKFYLRIMYPGLTIDKLSIIEKNCKIVCVDGGKMIIRNSFISEGTYLFTDVNASMVITDCFIGRYTHIAAKESIVIETGTLIAEMVVIRDQDHAFNNDPDNPNFSDYNIQPIYIGKNAWIASKATILKGVTVGDNAIVAASAVVNKSIPANEIWGGIPAMFIKVI